MQTFLPYADFRLSAQVLDVKRLGKQRVEVLQVLNSLDPESTSRGWSNHPAVRMWRGHEHALIYYGLVICSEWIGKGYKDTCFSKILTKSGNRSSLEELESRYRSATAGFLPFWLGDDRFHASHRSNLLRKNPGWYGQFGWKESSDLPYFWPC